MSDNDSGPGQSYGLGSKAHKYPQAEDGRPVKPNERDPKTGYPRDTDYFNGTSEDESS